MARHTTLVAALLALAVIAPAKAATYYVATNGNDAAAGSSAAPFLTWQRAVTAAAAGDTILIRSGTYAVTGTRDYGVTLATKSGTSSAPITLKAEGAIPLLDCSGITHGTNSINCLLLNGSDYWVIENLAITGTPQEATGRFPSGILVQNSDNNILRNLFVFEHEGTGVRVTGSSMNNLLQNIDSYSNADVHHASGIGRDADGIGVRVDSGATGNRVTGARVYGNGDDGLDLWESEAVVEVDGNWAFWNGYVPGTNTAAGNGVGFKLGRSDDPISHLVHHNIAFGNRMIGFNDNSAAGQLRIYNNTSYDNGSYQYQFSSANHVLRNNIALPATNDLGSNVSVDFNSWTLGITVATSHFCTTNASGVTGPRQTDGSLPLLPFLRPVGSNPLIDCGWDAGLGLGYDGTAPDQGAIEAQH